VNSFLNKLKNDDRTLALAGGVVIAGFVAWSVTNDFSKAEKNQPETPAQPVKISPYEKDGVTIRGATEVCRGIFKKVADDDMNNGGKGNLREVMGHSIDICITHEGPEFSTLRKRVEGYENMPK
jgi:hypothetical protein